LERSPRFGQPIEATADNGFDFGGYMQVDRKGGVVLGMNSIYSSYDASVDDIEAWLSDPRDRWGMPRPGWTGPGRANGAKPDRTTACLWASQAD
jgi:hypothetical protein